MSEKTEEEIIIIENSNASSSEIPSDVPAPKTKKTVDKKIIIIAALVLFALVVVGLLTYLLVQKNHKKNEVTHTQKNYETQNQEVEEVIEPSKLENMIAKADYLYSTGSKSDALSIYEKIAHFSEAVSAYNLGVAQLKDAQYETALSSFKIAIQNNEKSCVSAINAAVCALYLKNSDSFKYYIDLAYAYLPQESGSPLYSYYYALINYYKGNYYEALSALKNPTTKEYIKTQNSLNTNINALLNNNATAIEYIEQSQEFGDSFNLGLLYARVGNVAEAKKNLQSSMQNNIEPLKSKLALAFVYLKAGQISEAAAEIDGATDKFGDEVYKPYPIKVKLKESLFDAAKAQARYREILNTSKTIEYQKIFYYSPYKVFNANQTIDYIRKGNANIFVDDTESAQHYLKKGTQLSNVNIGITQAIKKALSFDIRESNTMLQTLVKIQPKHSVLRYNLALTYAQMGDIVNAHEQFLRSYNLDAKNYMSGIYAIMCSQLINKENKKLLSIILESLEHEGTKEEIDLAKTVLAISQNDFLATSDWKYNKYKETPLNLAIKTIIAIKLNDLDVAKKSSQRLTALLPNEILSHLIYIDANFEKLPTKKYASEVMNYLKTKKFTFDDLYYGPFITRYLFVQQNLITGKLYFLREQLKKALESTTKNSHEIISALALASLYDGAFEESYTLYNSLIDDLNVKDAHTLFLGAVASTAANHHENAIALLELSKLKDANMYESKYALGLLYIESKNNKGAVAQLNKISKIGFSSEFFSFDIDTEKLLFSKTNITNN
ncbi:hypothetical protein [Sulfurimonas sp.]|uniref:tetratricopeptide repeat protein n=1 Tax=Sulfurimonas sp. TaxID=2022749 RepID=UPI0025EA2490|nr:hypothetical protein [Sulfurimonas sp.]MDD5157261.1 hypothetical protein [Sulfurimonas sp.]